MYIRYICNKKCQVLLRFIYFSPVLRQICLWKSRDIIHEISRNSHFRALKIQSFLLPPTMVTIIFYIILAPHFWNGKAAPELKRTWFFFINCCQLKLRNNLLDWAWMLKETKNEKLFIGNTNGEEDTKNLCFMYFFQ